MAFEKGKSGNLRGRPPGGAKAATRAVSARFAQLLAGYSLEQMKTDLDTITDPAERLRIMLQMAAVCQPHRL